MKDHAIITTYYCYGCEKPKKDFVKNKLKYDGDIEDLFMNFSNSFDPFNKENIPYVGKTRRSDLVYGKIFMLRTFIEENIFGKYENIIHIDYSDTKFAKSCLEMVNKFKISKKEIVVSTEKLCWPYLETVSKWVNKELKSVEFSYLNSGAIISKTEYFLNILKKLENLCLTTNIDFWDDQGVWQYYNLVVEELFLDKNSEYFFSTAGLDDSYCKIENNIVKTKFNTTPFLIHDNSSFSMNLITKI